ncbi:hypothetical protein BsWGS_28902 [Bradybaena similaris]
MAILIGHHNSDRTSQGWDTTIVTGHHKAGIRRCMSQTNTGLHSDCIGSKIVLHSNCLTQSSTFPRLPTQLFKPSTLSAPGTLSGLKPLKLVRLQTQAFISQGKKL